MMKRNPESRTENASAVEQPLLRHQAKRFFSLIIPATLAFCGGILLRFLTQYHPGGVLLNLMNRFLSSPFDGCGSFSDCFCEVLLASSPALLVACLLLVFAVCQKPDAPILKLLALFSALCGFFLSALFYAADTTAVLVPHTGALKFCSLFSVLNQVLLLTLFSFRLSLSKASGFPQKSAIPGTFFCVFSYTLRLLFWSLFVTASSMAVLYLFSHPSIR